MWISREIWPKASRLSEGQLTAAIAVTEADNVVFSEIFAALNFNHLDRNLARVAEPMLATQGDIRALIFG